MQVLGLPRADVDSESGATPSPDLIERCGKFVEEKTKAGVLLATVGLQPCSKGKQVGSVSGKTAVIDGPFTASKERIALHALLEVKSMAEAVEGTTRSLPAVGGNECELRPLDEGPPGGA